MNPRVSKNLCRPSGAIRSGLGGTPKLVLINLLATAQPGDSGQSQICHRNQSWAGRPSHGAVLLEVVLALGLLVMVTAVVYGGLQASMAAVEELEFQTRAADLAVSVISEIQMGARPPVGQAAAPLAEPYADWMLQININPLGQSGATQQLQRVEIVISPAGGKRPFRLAQVMPAVRTPITEQEPADVSGGGQ